MPLIERAFLDQKRVFLPKISELSSTGEHQRFTRQKSQLEMLEIPDLESLKALVPVGPYKLLEPQSGLNALTEQGLDLVIVPGVLFTTKCSRMGHGAGFYDDYIKRHVEAGFARPKLVGIGLKEQLVESIPLEPHDEFLDAVILDDQLYMQ